MTFDKHIAPNLLRPLLLASALLAGSASWASARGSYLEDASIPAGKCQCPQTGSRCPGLSRWKKSQAAGLKLTMIRPCSLLAARPSSVDQVINQVVADIIWTVVGYTPGQLPPQPKCLNCPL